MAKLREALLIAYHFPPIGGSGVQRVLKLAKFLPRFGWRVHVVCCGHSQYPLLDDSLGDESGQDTMVYRTLGMEPAALATTLGHGLGTRWGARRVEDALAWRLQKMLNRTPLPEHELLWLPSAIRQARKIAEEHPVEMVITSGPPHCTHWVGEALRRRLGLPWIADLRDPILQNWARRDEGVWRRRYWRWLESAVAGRAEQVVVTCEEAGADLCSRYAALDPESVRFIPNGFDPEDCPSSPRRRDGEVFRLAHVGAFYRDQSVGPILEAIRIARHRNEAAGRLLRFDLMGSLSAQQRRLVRDEDSVFLRHYGYQPHGEAIAAMAAADALFLMTPSNEAGRLCIPAKTFEYLAFGPHIIAMIHADTMLARTLAEAGNVTLVCDRSAEALSDAILNCFEQWLAGRPQPSRSTAVVNRFRRIRQSEQFAELMDECAASRPRLRLVGTSVEALA